MNPRLLGLALILCAFFLVLPALAAQVDYPEDLKGIVAQYPGSQVEMAMKTQEGSHVVLTTSDPPQKAYAYYKESLTKAGWESKMEMTIKDGQQGHWKKGDKTARVVVASKDQGKTRIALMVGNY